MESFGRFLVTLYLCSHAKSGSQQSEDVVPVRVQGDGAVLKLHVSQLPPALKTSLPNTAHEQPLAIESRGPASAKDVAILCKHIGHESYVPAPITAL